MRISRIWTLVFGKMNNKNNNKASWGGKENPFANELSSARENAVYTFASDDTEIKI